MKNYLQELLTNVVVMLRVEDTDLLKYIYVPITLELPQDIQRDLEQAT